MDRLGAHIVALMVDGDQIAHFILAALRFEFAMMQREVMPYLAAFLTIKSCALKNHLRDLCLHALSIVKPAAKEAINSGGLRYP